MSDEPSVASTPKRPTATFPSLTKTYHTQLYPSISPTRPELSAKGKIVLVTGSGSGIGQATAIAFAQADAKALILCGRTPDTLETTKSKIDALEKGTRVLIIPLDISDESAVNSAFSRATTEFGGVDIVINSAGHLAAPGTLQSTSIDNFWRSFEVNVKGSLLVARAFLNSTSPISDPGRPKVILLLSSALCALPAIHLSTIAPAYPLSKLAEAKLAEFIAAENSHVRAYALQPGVVKSEVSLRSMRSKPDPEAFMKGIVWDAAELPAGFMLWLCSSRGEGMPSGRFLWVNWDVDELEGMAERLKGDDGLLTMGLLGWPFKG